MHSRRKEPFRYMFSVPVQGEFSVRRVNGREVSSRFAAAGIINFNKSGCRINTGLDLNAGEHEIKLRLHIALSGTPMELEGFVRWQQRAESGYDYGIQFELNEEQKDNILVALRTLAAANLIFAD